MSNIGGSQYSIEDRGGLWDFNPDEMYVDDRGPLVPALVKWDVRRLDPNEGRCLITNALLESGVAFIFCLSPKIGNNRKWKGRMEWYWGLRWNELKFDIPCNVFTVSRTLGGIFDFPEKKPSWILLPEDHIIDRFYEGLTKFDKDEKLCEDVDKIATVYASRGSLPVFEQTTFQYRLIPLPEKMESMLITHRANPTTHPEAPTSPNPSNLSVHLHPFDSLPWVTSHLDPKFVIMDAGRKIMLMPYSLIYKHDWLRSRPASRKVLSICRAWRAPIPSVAFSGKCPDYYTSDMGCDPVTVDSISQGHGQKQPYSDFITRKREKEAKEWVNRQNHNNFDAKQLPPLEEKGKWTATEVIKWSKNVAVQTELPAAHIPPLTSTLEFDPDQPMQDVSFDTQEDGSYPCLVVPSENRNFTV